MQGDYMTIVDGDDYVLLEVLAHAIQIMEENDLNRCRFGSFRKGKGSEKISLSLNMNEEKLLSVIVPVYKVEPYLHRCIDSIRNQTYKNLQIILVDDGSPDNCGKICDEYAEQHPRRHETHQDEGRAGHHL